MLGRLVKFPMVAPSPSPHLTTAVPLARLTRRVKHAYTCSISRNAASIARWKAGGDRMKLARMIAVALAAARLERDRRAAVCDGKLIGNGEGGADAEQGASEGEGAWSGIVRGLKAIRRVLVLSALFAPVAVLAPLAYSGVSGAVTEYAWEYAISGIEFAGPTFIKLCQWASTRSDLFPQEFCLRFSRLHDATRGHSWGETNRTMRESFGEGWEKSIQIDESRSPIGSGCIAQVYHGTLTKAIDLFPAGTEVAVKIVHPFIRDKVEVDFYILSKVAALLESIPRLNLKFLSVRDSVEQFRQVMVPQLDLRCEASNLER